MVLEESCSCKCYNNNVPISYYTKGVSFNDNIFNLGSESLSPKGLPIRVLLRRLGVVSDVCATDVCFPCVEDWRHNHNQPKFQLVNVRRIVVSIFGSSNCGWFISLIGCTGFKLLSTSASALCDCVPIPSGKKISFLPRLVNSFPIQLPLLNPIFENSSPPKAISGTWCLKFVLLQTSHLYSHWICWGRPSPSICCEGYWTRH